MALGIAGLRIGTWDDPQVPTGCTVVLPPEGSLGAIAVRGASPGTREAAALGAMGKVTVCHAVVLSGGSAYGLAVADGVQGWLEERGIGYPVGDDAVVPIVGAAILLDESVRHRGRRPDATAGRSACDGASEQDPPDGAVGAGAGCTVAVTGGLDWAWRGGQGTAVRRHGDLVVGAVVANNALGELVGEDGQVLLASRADPEQPRYPYGDPELHEPEGPTGNTVIGCVATNAQLTKHQAVRVADLAHTGIAAAVRPSHTVFDGDALFCLATQQVPAEPDLVATLAIEAVAEAARRGPLAAPSGGGLPGWADR